MNWRGGCKLFSMCTVMHICCFPLVFVTRNWLGYDITVIVSGAIWSASIKTVPWRSAEGVWISSAGEEDYLSCQDSQVICRAQWLRGRTTDSRLREPRFEFWYGMDANVCWSHANIKSMLIKIINTMLLGSCVQKDSQVTKHKRSLIK